MLDTINGLFNNLIFQLIIGSCKFFGAILAHQRKICIEYAIDITKCLWIRKTKCMHFTPTHPAVLCKVLHKTNYQTIYDVGLLNVFHTCNIFPFHEYFKVLIARLCRSQNFSFIPFCRILIDLTDRTQYTTI